MDTLPSIKNRAVLVNLTFHKPQMTKFDRTATSEAELKHGAKGALRTQKLLYPKHLIDPIVAVEAEARGYLRSNALEWGSSGLYLLDTTRYMEVRERLSEYELMRGQEVTRFAQNWASVLAEAEKQQGDLFDASVYPDVSDVVSQFTMRIFVAPVGEMMPELFSSVESELAEKITKDVQQATEAAYAGVIAQPLSRMIEAVLNLYDKTSRDNSRIHDSIVEQLQDVVALMPSFNVLNLPQLDALAEACKKRLVVDGDLLRGKENLDKRKEVADSAKRILTAVGMDDEALEGLSDQQARKAKAMAAADAIVAKMGAFV